MKSSTLEQSIAEKIAKSFPSAELVLSHDSQSQCFEIRLNNQLLISINQIGLKRFFPTRLRAEIKWSGIKEGGPDEIANLVIRSLADAGFDVFDSEGRKIRKTPVPIGKLTACPNCNEIGAIKRLVYGKPKKTFDLDKYILVGRSLKIGDPQIKCSRCAWKGSCEEVRFTIRRVTR